MISRQCFFAFAKSIIIVTECSVADFLSKMLVELLLTDWRGPDSQFTSFEMVTKVVLWIIEVILVSPQK